ncbi:bifunctional diguanylate cyclase/phosphodiesterase [Noviherbaspirillum pedocola]|uniref:Diguanylate cyclase n=1 Tax=Noviherbaspirillum pedocola TaxID=2801341 RepID=A0A934SRD2_9BURK|nr:diguanylate cyclase [Noviherbaspirillum pedocola]MBK4734152.1 diguanylate cyclase [Noviherbaspirillum pedocola]
MHEGEVAATNLAHAVEQQVDDAVTSADMILVGIVHRARHDAGKADALEDLNSILATQAAALPQLAGLFVYDENGRWIANSLRTLPRNANNADREYFQYHRDHATPGPFIGPPVRSRLTGDWILTVSRRIDHPDGSFAGVALATIPLSYFQKYYARFNLGERGLIALLRDDGTLLARLPFVESGIGKNLSSMAIFQDYLNHPGSGSTHRRSELDGVARIYAYQHSERYPILVTAALAHDDVLLNWKRDAASNAAALLLLTTVVALTGWRFIRQLRLRQRSERALAESEQKIRSITDNLPVLISYVDRNRRFGFVNATMQQILRKPMSAILGQPMADVIGEERYRDRIDNIDAALAGNRVEFELEAATPDGTRHVHTVYLPDVGQDGEVHGFHALSADITELRAAEARIRAIADNLPALIAYVDSDQCFRFSNNYARELPLARSGSLTGMTVAEAFGEAAYPALLPHLQAALEGDRMSFEHALGVDDAARVLHCEFVPDRDRHGRVLGFHWLATDISAQKRVERQLQRLARFDALTGLPNRSLLQDRLAEAILRARRGNTRLALLFLDVDRFKTINDSLGHHGGDEVLVQFAQRLKASVRISDTVARLAGDEFVILLEGLPSADEATLVADKILGAMQSPFSIAGALRAVSTSIGIAVSGPGEPGTPESLLKTADEALYAAKRAGRNAWEMLAA